jgi:hypothetical protein
LKPNQRYRNAYGDKRLEIRVETLQSRMTEKQTIVVNRLSGDPSEKAAFYNCFNNPYVEISELIDRHCYIAPEVVEDKCLLSLLDTTSVSLLSWLREKRKASPMPGVVEDNRTPGFFMLPSLVVEEQTLQIKGLGDMVLFDRPKSQLRGKAAVQARNRRGQLPLEEKESYAWVLAAANSQKRLLSARQVTYVLDQGGDKYETLAQLRVETGGADFIVRSKEDRMAVGLVDGEEKEGRLSELLQTVPWQAERQVDIRALDHYSKSSGKRVLRKSRKARLKMRYMQVRLCVPSGLKSPVRLDDPLTVIEVLEDAESVPKGEDPIHWRLMTTRQVGDEQGAWHIVDCYQGRWFIEQLFRVFKTQGLDIEHSEFENADAVKKQAVLALKSACQVMQLTMARDAETFTPLETVFPRAEEKQVLEKLNGRVSGKTEKITNPHPDNSLAWAVWIIARLGGWSGYKSGRKPGPVTIHRGLETLHTIFWTYNLMNDP